MYQHSQAASLTAAMGKTPRRMEQTFTADKGMAEACVQLD